MRKERMKTPRIYYPWNEVPKGGSFFVPTLALAATKEAGLTAALYFQLKVTAKYGILDGKHGILFTRRS